MGSMVDTQVALEGVIIPAGDYLVFSGEGEMPQVVIDIWGEIWGYFGDEACTHTRAFTVDFE